MIRRSASYPLVIDTDPGIDDALAIMLALRSPELRVELVTTVAGNTSVRAATDNARRLLALLDPDAPPRLVRGAARPLRGRLKTAPNVHGGDGLAGLSGLLDRRGRPLFPASDGPKPAGGSAATAIVAKAREHAEALTIAALGPLTNIARALDEDAAAMRRIRQLFIMGGAITEPGNVTPGAEFNIHVDPVAADRVLSSGMRITLVPLDVTRKVRVRWPLVRDALRGDRSRLARALRHFTRTWASSRDGMPLHDPLTVALAIDHGLAGTRALRVRVETKGEHTRGMTIADRRGIPPGRPRDGETAEGTVAQLVDVAVDVDADRVLQLVAQRVFGAGRIGDRQADVVVVGAANVDLTAVTRTLPRPGETLNDGVLHSGFGGKGANQAVAARRAGAEVAFAGRLGNDGHAEQYLAHLQAEGVDTGAVGRDARAASGVALIAVDERGSNQISVAPGANARLRPAHLAAAMRRIRRRGVVAAELEVPIAVVESAFRSARSAGATTLLNAAPIPADAGTDSGADSPADQSPADQPPADQSPADRSPADRSPAVRVLPESLVALTDLVVVNEIEAEQLTGLPVTNVASGRHAATALVAGGFRAAVVTLGERGAVWADGRKVGREPSPKVEVVDTVGAGDTFIGYLACGLARGLALGEGVAEAVRAAALAVTRHGAQPGIPRRAEIARKLPG